MQGKFSVRTRKEQTKHESTCMDTLYSTCGGQWWMPLRMTVNRNWTHKTNPLIHCKHLQAYVTWHKLSADLYINLCIAHFASNYSFGDKDPGEKWLCSFNDFSYMIAFLTYPSTIFRRKKIGVTIRVFFFVTKQNACLPRTRENVKIPQNSPVAEKLANKLWQFGFIF